MSDPTYRLSTYDPGDTPEAAWSWRVQLTGLPRWGLRAAIRWARGQGYETDTSILVERED